MSVHLPYRIDENQNRNHYYETYWKVLALDLLARHEADLKGMSLLDFGSGRGETMKLAAGRGMSVCGTDIDPECVRLSSEFGSASILDVDDPLGQFGENSVDVVTCFHVLEHVPCPVETLSILSKIARKHVLLAVPNLSRFHDLLRPSRWVESINEGHLQSWDHSHFKNLAEGHCNLKIVEWEHDAVIIPPFSNFLIKIFGEKMAMRFEMGLFRKLHPFASISVLALATPVNEK